MRLKTIFDSMLINYKEVVTFKIEYDINGSEKNVCSISEKSPVTNEIYWVFHKN